MNLLEALEKKKAIEEVIQDKTNSIEQYLQDQIMLSEVLTDIDSLIDQFYELERLIQKNYESVMVSQTESISDVISYADALSEKINVLKHLLLQAYKNQITINIKSDVDTKIVITSIKQYEDLRSVLIKKIKDVCFNTSLSA
ncbi:MAG: hypothetical protein KAS32_26180 [Candidatus Peribacteraceae bacterium]|nr:hypothetical protein [Candidatus Peribacteraceae bacterium]